MMTRLLLALILVLSAAGAEAAVRIKDIADIRGLRENQIVGYGLVIGLNGTGDTLRNAPFTEQSLQSMLDNMGINVRNDNTNSTTRPTTLRTRNVAAVMVTADLPPSIEPGERMDVTVSSLGDATSLLGGTLVMTPLRAADGAVYAVAQGSVTVAGYSVQGQAQSVTQGTPTAGRIPNGALVERAVQGSLHEMEFLVLELKNPDFVTATRILDAINHFAGGRYRAQIAFERDYRTIVLSKPRNVGPVRFLAEIGELTVEPDTPDMFRELKHPRIAAFHRHRFDRDRSLRVACVSMKHDVVSYASRREVGSLEAADIDLALAQLFQLRRNRGAGKRPFDR